MFPEVEDLAFALVEMKGGTSVDRKGGELVE